MPPLGLGSWNIWDRMTQDEAVTMIHRAAEADAGLFDVAVYNTGPHAEDSTTDTRFGKALRASGVARDEVVICGKLWLWQYPDRGFRAQLEESLERAGLDRFDAVVLGDYATPPDMARVVADVSELIADGLFAVWGINNWVIGDTRAAFDAASTAGLVPPSFAQLKYSVARRAMAEGEPYRALFESGRLALQASDVFEGGVLLGNSTPARRIGADVGSIRDRIARTSPAIAAVAARFGATASQLAIAFCLANGHTANVLFGASRPEQLEANLGAVPLAAELGAEIRAALVDLRSDGDVPADGTWPPDPS